MIKRIFTNFVAEFKNLSPTSKGMIILCILLIIGIILRWDTTIEGIKRGFGFFSGN